MSSRHCDSERYRSRPRSYDRQIDSRGSDSRGSKSSHHSRYRRSSSSPEAKDSDDARHRKYSDVRRPQIHESEKPSGDRHHTPRSSKKTGKSGTSDRDSSSSESDSQPEHVSDEELDKQTMKVVMRLEIERWRAKEKKRLEKEAIKANETPEQKRMRRLLKKATKERKQREKLGWDSEYLQYTNTDNPFGDAQLLAPFVWKKKVEKEGFGETSLDELESSNKAKQEEKRKELEKVRERRKQYEEERQRRQDELTAIQREKEASQFHMWEQQEDKFHLEQARLRSKIRIKDGRAKPIDLLAEYISPNEDVDAVDMHEPYTYLNGLTVADLEDLLVDIKVYKELDRDNNLDYWNDITIIVENELQKLNKLDTHSQYKAAVARREGLHSSVANEVLTIFKGKTSLQLAQLQKQIEDKLSGNKDGVDIGYWESLLFQLKAHLAKARLRDRHQDKLRQKLEMLKAEQGVEESSGSETNAPEAAGTSTTWSSIVQSKQAASSSKGKAEIATNDDVLSDTELENILNSKEENEAEDDMIGGCLSAYIEENYTPRRVSPDHLEPGTLFMDPDEDHQRLEFARQRVLFKGERVDNVLTTEEHALEREAKKGMTDDEAVFSVETNLTNQVYLWSDKYRPRKPRYFNRVHTGFEWNKYNQTHYDMDNPPPKIVQGYKFNIFYPDLINKGATPQYHLTPCKDNPDFALLRFESGPPYEDIAFKIVNREWEFSYKRGFRCQFHNNIFQLWFHFKRYRYRR